MRQANPLFSSKKTALRFALVMIMLQIPQNLDGKCLNSVSLRLPKPNLAHLFRSQLFKLLTWHSQLDRWFVFSCLICQCYSLVYFLVSTKLPHKAPLPSPLTKLPHKAPSQNYLSFSVCLSSTHPGMSSFLRIISLSDYFLDFLDTVL